MSSARERRRHHRTAKNKKAEEFVHESCGFHPIKEFKKHLIGAALLFGMIGFIKGLIIGYLVAERKSL